MKVTTKESPQFVPFEFSVRVETRRELELLWGMFNGSGNSRTEFVNSNIGHTDIQLFNYIECCQEIQALWKILNDNL